MTKHIHFADIKHGLLFTNVVSLEKSKWNANGDILFSLFCQVSITRHILVFEIFIASLSI